jgi:hypothetical protein
MLTTNRHFEAELEKLNHQFAKIEAGQLGGPKSAAVASLLADLNIRRSAVRLVLLRRRIEASKKIVDLKTWREGGDAMQLLRRWSAAEPVPGAVVKRDVPSDHQRI